MDVMQLEALLVSEVVESFPQARAIVLWGGSAKQRYIPGQGDVDVIIVLPYEEVEEHSIRGMLGGLIERFRAEYDMELDPAVITPEQLSSSPSSFLVVSGLYKAHGVLQYLLKNQGKVIYGDSSVLDTIPNITLNKALKSIVPLISDKTGQIRAELTTSQSASEEVNLLQLSSKHLSSFLVFTRTIFSAETGQIGSKLQAIDYIRTNYPRYAHFMDLLSAIYKNDGPATVPFSEVTKEEINSYLGLVEEVAHRLSQVNGHQDDQL